MSILPAPISQQKEFTRLQLAVDAIADLGDIRDPSVYEPLERSDPFGAGPNDEYLGFGMIWWRYLTSGASQFIPAGATRSRLAAYANPSVSLGACIHGMSRVLLHLSQLDDAEFTKAVGGMIRARFLMVAMSHNPDVAEALVALEVAPWPSTEPALHSRRKMWLHLRTQGHDVARCTVERLTALRDQYNEAAALTA